VTSLCVDTSERLAHGDACFLLEAFQSGSARPSDVLNAMLTRAARIDPVLNAIVARDESILDTARASDERWANGSPKGPLDGVPIIVKDNLHATGLPTSWGNAALARQPVAHDELPIARLRRAGALLIGKANVPEFTLEGHTCNNHFGATRNPWDVTRVPGGSSGGVAAAVAAGLATVGIGTDGGGSIRRPAGYTGLIGLKPGIGTVARANGLPPLLLDFETVGPMTRSVRDASLLFETLQGSDRRDATSRKQLNCRRRQAPPRVLVVEHMGKPAAPVEVCILDALECAAALLEAYGCHLVCAALPVDVAPLDALWPHVGEIGLAEYFRTRPDVAAAAAPTWRDAAERGASLGAGTLSAILATVRAIRNATSAAFADADAILMPTASAMPWPIEQPFPEIIDGRAVGPRGHAIYTGWVNAAGHPALALPAPVAEGALPIGVQLIGDLGSERALLELGAGYERLIGDLRSPPPFVHS